MSGLFADPDIPYAELHRLAELGDHLLQAEHLLESNPHLAEVLATANAAIRTFVESITGQRLLRNGALQISLKRTLGASQLYVDSECTGETGRLEIAAFITELRLHDEQLMRYAELLGLLMSLGVKWAASGFSPPIILLTLSESAPRILALGQSLAMSGN